jgi:hypothetical protein
MVGGDKRMKRREEWPRVAIIILNWNGWQDTIECLESVYQIMYANYDVIVVDNDSQDESIDKIKGYGEGKIEVVSDFFGYDPSNKPIEIVEYTREEAERAKEGVHADFYSDRRLIIIKNEKNYGFAEGNNIAIRYAMDILDPKYILLLNNDTVVESSCLTELIKAVEVDNKIGIVGPKIYYYDYFGRTNIIWSAGGRIKWWRLFVSYYIGTKEEDIGQFESIHEVDWVSGAALMIKCRIIDTLSLFDSEYFIGPDDVDYCLKAQKHGIKVTFAPKARIWHKVSASRKKLSKAQIPNLSLSYRLVKKNFSSAVYIYHLGVLPIILLMWGTQYLIKYRDRQTLTRFLKMLKNFVC